MHNAYAARFRIVLTGKTLRTLLIHTQTLIGIFFVYENGDMHGCLTKGLNLLYFDRRHLETIVAN